MASTLDGITVLDLGTGAAAAFATMLLSDLGARVVRVTDPGVPLHRDGGFVVWDRGKECVALDLSSLNLGGDGEDTQLFRRLGAGADVSGRRGTYFTFSALAIRLRYSARTSRVCFLSNSSSDLTQAFLSGQVRLFMWSLK